MGLRFAAATHGDYINHGSGASLDNLDPVTMLAWIRTPTAINAGYVISRIIAGATSELYIDGSGNLHINRVRATTSCKAQADGIVTADTWQFVGGTFNTGGVNGDQKLWRGTLTAIAAEPTYSIQRVGAGTVSSDAAGQHFVGGADGYADDWAALNDYIVAWIGIWNRALTTAEVIAQQFRPHVTSGCVLFVHYGFNGTGSQPDWSGNGNSGTVSGTAVADHVPLGMPYPTDPLDLAWAVAAGGPVALAGVSAGVATVSGAAQMARALAAVSGGSTSPVGAVSVARALAALASGAAGVSGQVAVTRALAGQSAGVSTVAGAARIARALAALSAGQSSVTAALTVEELLVALAGLSQGATSLTAALRLTRALAGSSSALSVVSGSVSMARALAGQSAGQTAITAALARSLALAGSSSGQTSLAALLVIGLLLWSTGSIAGPGYAGAVSGPAPSGTISGA